MVRRHIPTRHIPIATFTHATFTHRRHLPIASIRYDAWSIRYLIVVAYGYLSRENRDLIEAMGKCRLWVNVAWVNVAMGISRMAICRLNKYRMLNLSNCTFKDDYNWPYFTFEDCFIDHVKHVKILCLFSHTLNQKILCLAGRIFHPKIPCLVVRCLCLV